MDKKNNIIIYNTPDGKASVSLYTKDGMVDEPKSNSRTFWHLKAKYWTTCVQNLTWRGIERKSS